MPPTLRPRRNSIDELASDELLASIEAFKTDMRGVSDRIEVMARTSALAKKIILQLRDRHSTELDGVLAGEIIAVLRLLSINVPDHAAVAQKLLAKNSSDGVELAEAIVRAAEKMKDLKQMNQRLTDDLLEQDAINRKLKRDNYVHARKEESQQREIHELRTQVNDLLAISTPSIFANDPSPLELRKIDSDIDEFLGDMPLLSSASSASLNSVAYEADEFAIDSDMHTTPPTILPAFKRTKDAPPVTQQDDELQPANSAKRQRMAVS